MHEERKLGIPSLAYIRTCEEGYRNFGFDVKYLDRAYISAYAARIFATQFELNRISLCSMRTTGSWIWLNISPLTT